MSERLSAFAQSLISHFITVLYRRENGEEISTQVKTFDE